MKKTSSIFLNNLTQIDYAEIDVRSLTPKGGSYQLNAIVSGKVDDVEQVVVDFSKIKKDIKGIVDDQNEGYDHKLWVPVDNTNINVEEDSGEIQISTMFFESISPTNATQFITKNIVLDINSLVENYLNKKYPLLKINTQSELTQDNYCPSHLLCSKIDFRYMHGLRNSSSWGCQNMNHGHLSWMAFADKDNSPVLFPFAQSRRLKDELNNSIFIWEENVRSIKNGFIEIEYRTPRGLFYSKYSKNSNKVIIVSEDTTIENLADWFVKKYYDVLIEYGVKAIYMSEGLSKGSVIEIE